MDYILVVFLELMFVLCNMSDFGYYGGFDEDYVVVCKYNVEVVSIFVCFGFELLC